MKRRSFIAGAAGTAVGTGSLAAMPATARSWRPAQQAAGESDPGPCAPPSNAVPPGPAGSWAPQLSPVGLLERLSAETVPQHGFAEAAAADVPRWQSRARLLLAQLLGWSPATDLVDPGASVTGNGEVEDYHWQRMLMATQPAAAMPVWVLTPSNRRPPHPAVIALHGHGAGAIEVVDRVGDWQTRAHMEEHRLDFGPRLVRAGFKVFAPELLGFGERRHPVDLERPPLWDSERRLNGPLLLLGRTLLGLRTWDVARLVDVILARDDVAPDAVGCVGFSAGAAVALYAAALDTRLAATLVSGYLSTWMHSLLSRFHTEDNYVPGLARWFDAGDLAALVAPRPLFVEAAREDDHFPLPGVLEAIEHGERAYAALGAAGELRLHVFDGPHRFDGDESIPWLVEQLSF